VAEASAGAAEPQEIEYDSANKRKARNKSYAGKAANTGVVSGARTQ